MVTFLAWFSQVLLALLGVFLMIVILLQRGRGGGLAGAFGGMGGQSAFGTKAGDVFTRITIVLAILWVVVSGGSGYFLRAAAEQKGRQFGDERPASVADEPIPTRPSAAEVPDRPQPPNAAQEEPAGGSPSSSTTPEASSESPQAN